MIFVNFEEEIVANENNLVDVLSDSDDFFAYCEDNWDDTEFYKENEELQKMVKEEEAEFIDLPDEWQSEIRAELMNDYIDENFSVFEEDRQGNLVGVD